MFRSINPYDQSLLNEFAAHDEGAISAKVKAAAKLFQSWKRESFALRGNLLMKAGRILRDRKEYLAKTIAMEMGKTLSEASAEIEKCANACDYFAENAERFLKDQMVPFDQSKSLVAFQPLGPVLAVMPWNYPFWQVFRFAAPALMAGNVCLLKHAANVSQCSLEIEKIFIDAGFPGGAFQSLLVDSGKVAGLIQMNEIAAVTLTGSEYAGTQVGAAAGSNIKKTVLELGGSDPFIVLEDADLPQAARIATQSRMQNAGQSCIAAKRFIVIEAVKEEFLHLFRVNIEALRQGNPLDESTTTGPVARMDLAADLEKQLLQALQQGAKLLTGGKRNGCNFSPTLVDNIAPGNIAFDEEIFGPIAAVVTVRNEGEAIKMANASRYGLGASVWTNDRIRGERVAREIESGCVFVNSLMRSDQRLPFGGIKKSGYGRELSELGIKEFVNAKSISVW